MRKITANYIYPVTSAPIKNGVIVISKSGEILEIGNRSDFNETELEYHKGIIVPGFINTHCHLELSHLKGLVDTGTGLIDFISHIVKYRDFEATTINEAIELQDKLMWEAGIMAVGDISNKSDTVAVKSRSRIDYYTFVEMFDFMQPSLTEETIDKYIEVYKQHGSEKSYVPHAPYTVSKSLFEFIKKSNPLQSTISIHNQETAEENQLFETGDGGFIDFYRGFDMKLSELKANGESAIHYAMNNMDPSQRTLFVHNTMTNKNDIEAANQWSDNVYWATCANANLYIENQLPNYQIFIELNAKMTIGTDSLSSNWQLSILEEMKTIQKYNSYISFDTLLRWATINGAESLGMIDKLGSIEPGKQPGLLLLNIDLPTEEIKLNKEHKVVRIV